jgi:hypothetical protein
LKASPRRYHFVVGAIVIAATFIPIPYLASPRWEVLVVDSGGNPVEGMTVRSIFQNYSAEASSHEENQQTDKSGHASFPAHWLRASMSARVVFTLLSSRAGVHAGFGRHASVFAFGHGLQGSAASGQYVLDWTGAPAEVNTQIIAARTADLGR